MRTESTAPDVEDGRGGDPPRAFFSATGGELQDALYRAPHLHALLAREVGRPVRPAGERGTYSYYEKPGDHLGLHRDVSHCDLTLITCLRDPGGPGAVCVWPERIEEPLSAIRASPEDGAVRVPLAPGQSLLVLGGVLPHALLPVAPGQERVASILCFEVGT